MMDAKSESGSKGSPNRAIGHTITTRRVNDGESPINPPRGTQGTQGTQGRTLRALLGQLDWLGHVARRFSRACALGFEQT